MKLSLPQSGPIVEEASYEKSTITFNKAKKKEATRASFFFKSRELSNQKKDYKIVEKNLLSWTCVGEIHGYFDGEPPVVFWQYYSLYAAMTFAADIVWSLRITPDHMHLSYKRLAQILEDHKHFRGYEPIWYSNFIKETRDKHV